MLDSVFLDANIFVMGWTADVLLSCAEHELYDPHWSDLVMDETIRTIYRIRGPQAHPERYVRAIRTCFPRAEVDVHPEDIVDVDLPDPDDRHVVSGAYKAGCNVILTYNLKDFPQHALSRFGLSPMHPDAFLMSLVSSYQEEVLAAMRELMGLKRNPPRTAHEEVRKLKQNDLVCFSEFLSKSMGKWEAMSDKTDMEYL